MDEVSLLALQNEITELEKVLTAKKRQVEELQSVNKEIVQNVTQKLLPEKQINNQSPPEEKIALFRSLFRGREDVYAKLMKLRFIFDFTVRQKAARNRG
ncbi:MAG: hypothetical protein LBH16_07030 [Treponema sp.]|jgi:hypothetical protein|nr:hypothetical protein [Treponema sp.]